MSESLLLIYDLTPFIVTIFAILVVVMLVLDRLYKWGRDRRDVEIRDQQWSAEFRFRVDQWEYDKQKRETHREPLIEHRPRDDQFDIHLFLAPISLGLDLERVRLPRYIPIRLYSSQGFNKYVDELRRSIEQFVEASELEVVDSLVPTAGSWLKEWIARTTSPETLAAVRKRLEMAERALELAKLGKVQSEIDKNQAEAASSVISALENIPNAFSQIGSVVVVKVTDKSGQSRVVIKTLSGDELLGLENNRDLRTSPESLMSALENDQLAALALESSV